MGKFDGVMQVGIKICNQDDTGFLIIKRIKYRLMPGNAMESLLRLAGIKSDGKCGCANMKHQMNLSGWKWCWRNRKLILDHLASEAKKRGIAVKPSMVSMVFAYGKRILLNQLIFRINPL